MGMGDQWYREPILWLSAVAALIGLACIAWSFREWRKRGGK